MGGWRAGAIVVDGLGADSRDIDFEKPAAEVHGGFGSSAVRRCRSSGVSIGTPWARMFGETAGAVRQRLQVNGVRRAWVARRRSGSPRISPTHRPHGDLMVRSEQHLS